ncbi:MAG: LEA type 2 family protein [Thermoanaerobaculia bacterium]|nr:LEA type 2 family protein [Thermoanaerobaculia bacterium]
MPTHSSFSFAKVFNLSIVLSIFLIGLTGSGCNTVTEADLQVTKLHSVRVSSMTREELRLVVEIEVENQRKQDVSFHDLEFRFGLRGDPIGIGTIGGRQDIAAGGRKLLAATVVVPFGDVQKEDFDAFFEKDVPYQIEGHATLIAPIEGLKLRFAIQGTLSVSEVLEVRASLDDLGSHLGPPRLKTRLTDLLTQSGEVEVDLANPFRFALPLAQIEYRILLADSTVGRGEVAHGLQLEPGVHRLRLPVEAQLGGAVSGLLSSFLEPRRATLKVVATVVVRHGERMVLLQLTSDPGGGSQLPQDAEDIN